MPRTQVYSRESRRITAQLSSGLPSLTSTTSKCSRTPGRTAASRAIKASNVASPRNTGTTTEQFIAGILPCRSACPSSLLMCLLRFVEHDRIPFPMNHRSWTSVLHPAGRLSRIMSFPSTSLISPIGVPIAIASKRGPLQRAPSSTGGLFPRRKRIASGPVMNSRSRMLTFGSNGG